MAANYTNYPGMQPCNGAVATYSDVVADQPFAVDTRCLALCSRGTGATVADVKGGILITNDLSIATAGSPAGGTWAQSGYGYEVNMPKHATNYNTLRTNGSVLVPGAGGSFTAILLFRMPASTSGTRGWFEKCDNAFAHTKGYGVYSDGTNLIGWVDDPTNAAKRVTIALSSMPSSSEYGLIMLRYDADAQTLDLYVHKEGGDVTAQTTSVVATTLNSSGYSDLYVGSQAAASPGNTCFGGAVVMFTMIAEAIAEYVWEELVNDPFCLFAWPRDTQITFELPQTINGYTQVRAQIYIPTLHALTDDTIVECPATPATDGSWNQQEWLDSTFGDTETGTASGILEYADYSNRTFKQVCDATNAAYLSVSIFANGSPIVLDDSSTPNATDARQKYMAAFEYIDGHGHPPFVLDDPRRVVLTGMSSGCNVAFELALQTNRANRCILRHGSETNSSDPTTVIDALNYAVNTLYARNYVYAVPIALTWGSDLSTFTGGTGAETYSSSGLTCDWENSDAAKAMEIVWINGASDATYADDVADMFTIMRSLGYQRCYAKSYSGGIHDHHGRDRDLVERYLRYGLRGFIPSGADAISEDGPLA